MTPDPKAQRDAVDKTAAEWVVRLATGGCSEAQKASLEAWLAADPAHEVAFERANLAWERTERLRALAAVEPGRAAPEAERRRQRSWKIPARIAAAVAASAAVAGGGLLWAWGPTKAYATAVGERRVVVLDDGSRVEMNTDTRLEVRISPTGRRARLVRGEALFEVRSDPRRSFIVRAQDEEVKGGAKAAFNLRLAQQTVKVLVVDGQVEVRGRSGPEGRPFESRLTAGALGTFGAAGAAARNTSSGEAERALAWRYGAIILSGESLSEAAAEFNRYNVKPIVVADPSIAGLRLGGYFKQADVEGFARALQTGFGVKAVDTGKAIYLSRAAPARRAAF